MHVNEENVVPFLRYRLGKVPSQLVNDFGLSYDLTSLMHADAQVKEDQLSLVYLSIFHLLICYFFTDILLVQ